MLVSARILTVFQSRKFIFKTKIKILNFILFFFLSTPIKIDDVSKYPNLIKALFDDGWGERDLVKLVYGNVMRVFADVEKVFFFLEIIVCLNIS